MIDKERYERVFCSCMNGNKIRDYFEGTNIRTCSNSCWAHEHCSEGRYLYRDKYTGKIVDPYEVNSHIPTAHEIAVAYDDCYDI